MQLLASASMSAASAKPEKEGETWADFSTSGSESAPSAKKSAKSAQKSGWLQQSLIDHDARSEKSIALAQARICCFVLVLHLIEQYSSQWQSLNLWVRSILTGLILSSVFPFLAAGAKPLPLHHLEILNVTIITIFLSLIWSYQFAYDYAASGILKAPSMTLLFALIVLRALRSLGVRIAMDDFVTGYSSLSYLRSFPFDKIKIDGFFIKDLENSEDAAAIVRAIAGLGASLGMTTAAECVETEEQMARVAAGGYGEIQVFQFSPPRSANEVAGFYPPISKQASAS